MVIVRDSKGCLSASITWRWNSGASSINRTPPWARVTSPGRPWIPPPTILAKVAVWWGFLKGRVVTNPVSPNNPITSCIRLTSMISFHVIGGNMVGNLSAIIVLPPPGGPIIIQWWWPAALMSIARFPSSCPCTSLKSTVYVWLDSVFTQLFSSI